MEKVWVPWLNCHSFLKIRLLISVSFFNHIFLISVLLENLLFQRKFFQLLCHHADLSLNFATFDRGSPNKPSSDSKYSVVDLRKEL